MTNTENVKKPAKTPRVDMPCQPAAVRAHNFKEVALGYSLEQAQLEASRCLQCKNPRCRQGCPVEVRIPEFIAQVVKGDIAEAYRILKSTNSLPAVCGRVCPQENQCEGKCILGVKGERWLLAVWNALSPTMPCMIPAWACPITTLAPSPIRI